MSESPHNDSSLQPQTPPEDSIFQELTEDIEVLQAQAAKGPRTIRALKRWDLHRNEISKACATSLGFPTTSQSILLDWCPRTGGAVRKAIKFVLVDSEEHDIVLGGEECFSFQKAKMPGNYFGKLLRGELGLPLSLR
jgi:hypothetical protein